MESSIAVFLSRQPACERLPTMQPPTVCAKTCCYAPLLCACCCLLRSRPRAVAGCCALMHRWRAPLAARTAGSCCCCVAAAVAAVTAAAALLCACYLLRFQPPLLRLLPAWVGLGLGGGSNKSVFNIKPDTKLDTPGARAGVVVSLQAGWGS